MWWCMNKCIHSKSMTQVTAMTWLWTAPKQHYLRISGRGKEGDSTTRSCSMQTGWWREDDHRIWINSHILHSELNILCTELFAATFCRGKWFFSGGMSQSREHHNESSCCTRYLIIHPLLAAPLFAAVSHASWLGGWLTARTFRGRWWSGGWFALKVHVYKSSKVYPPRLLRTSKIIPWNWLHSTGSHCTHPSILLRTKGPENLDGALMGGTAAAAAWAANKSDIGSEGKLNWEWSGYRASRLCFDSCMNESDMNFRLTKAQLSLSESILLVFLFLVYLRTPPLTSCHLVCNFSIFLLCVLIGFQRSSSSRGTG